MATTKQSVLSLMRTSGMLHLGNYHGAIKNWIELQDKYQCFYGAADWHGLTTEFENPKELARLSKENIIDLLACGIDPEKSVVFVQSHIKEHAELYLLLGMITPTGWLSRSPSYKEMKTEIKDRDLDNLGFLGYPVLQAADIVIYKANFVPVGVDQQPHVELTREIVRRFNGIYGKVFPEPKTLLTETPKVLGTDGRKMSKSYGNAIYLSDEPAIINKKVLTMFTDPARKTKKDKGNPDICNVFSYHKMYSGKDTINMVDEECRRAGIGCFECKTKMAESLVKTLEPMHKKRKELEKNPKLVDDIIIEGDKKARAVACATMEDVREKIKLWKM